MPVIQLELDSSGAVSSLKQFDRAVDATEKNTTSNFTRMAKGVTAFAAVAAAATAAAMLSIAKASITAASDMQEVQGKFDVVFREIGSYAEDAAARIAGSYGLSKRATKQYMSSIQDLLVPTGLARDKAAEMSVAFTELAVDLGSFNNMETATVVRDIQSALAGGSETMTKYGIDVKVAAVKAEVLALGLDTSTKAAERQARTVALLSIMQRDSSDAMGDFARTTESYANQTKILEGNLEDLRAGLGDKLLPVATHVVKIFNQWITSGDRMNKIINVAIEVVRFLVNGYFGLEMVLKGTIVIIAKLAEGFIRLATPMKWVLDAMVAIGAIESNPIAALQQTMEDFTASAVENLGTTVDKIESFNKMMDGAKESTIKAGDAQVTASQAVVNTIEQESIPAEQKLATEIDKVTVAADEATISLDKQAKAARSVATALGAWNDAAAAETAVDGVSVSMGESEMRWINGQWTSQSGEHIEDFGNSSQAEVEAGYYGQGGNVYITTPVGKNSLREITTGQTTQKARA